MCNEPKTRRLKMKNRIEETENGFDVYVNDKLQRENLASKPEAEKVLVYIVTEHEESDSLES